MEEDKFAQLSSETLDEITALENKLGVILIAYDISTATHQLYDNNNSSYPINPS